MVIHLEPGVYNYHISLAMIDSAISPFYGGLKVGLPVYIDTAQFDLSIKVNNFTVTAKISNIVNGPPSVVPPVKTYQESQFIWIPDPNGVINITGLEEGQISMDPDSTVSLIFLHSNAYSYGVMIKSARDGTIQSNEPPQLFGGNIGIPQSIEIDLKKRDPYIIISGGLGKYMNFGIVPK